METAKQSYFNISAKWAVIYTITSIIITYLFQFLNIDPTTSPLRFLAYIPLIAFLLLAQKEYRDQLNGFMTFGQGFISGFVYSIIIGVLGAIFIALYYSILSPQAWEQILTATRDKMTENKDTSSAQVNQAMSFMTKYGILSFSVGLLIMTPIIGAVISLIGAAIFKKERSLADIENEASSNFEQGN